MSRLSHQRPGDARARAAQRGASRGETLVEIMVAIIIMGTAIVSVLSAISTMIIQSASHRGQVRSANEAIYVAELIQNATYVNCATTSSYDSAFGTGVYTRPNGYTVAVTQVRYLSSRGGPTTPPPYTPSFQAGCPTNPDYGAQEITVTVKANSGGNRLTGSVVLVKWRKT